MRSNLNLLSKDKIEELEQFVKLKFKNYDEEVEGFFSSLKSGKLKNKRIEVDALDFIQEGLTEIVDFWINENLTQKVEERKDNAEKVGNVEKLVCASHTRVGKFLNKYNKKQISLDDGIKKLKQDRRLSEVLTKIADTQTRKDYFFLGDHDLNHTKRVLLNASMIMELRKDLTDREREMIFTAIEYHDTGRIHDFEDNVHGQRAVQKFTNELHGFSVEEQDLIKFIIIQHCKSSAENKYAINTLNKSEKDKEKYKLFLNYMKDADKLDRVRFPEISPYMTDSLDPDRLYFDESKQIIKFACEALENSETLFELKNDKSKDALFNRKKVFAEYESAEDKAKSVEKFLKENGYPPRSSNLKLKNLKPQEQKFIKDGYLYLLRGSRQGQTSGFFTYQYANEKKNLEQYLKENPRMTADMLASKQSMKGRERFISTTTDITVAAEFTKLNKDNNEQGSIYVIKVKPEDAFRVVSPVGLDEFWGDKSQKDESEYLIPDYIKPEEILKEFKYNEYEEIYKYLKEEIGLNIKKSDIYLREDVSKQIELSDEFLDNICKMNEAHNHYWGDSETASDGFELVTEGVNKGKGRNTLEKIMNFLVNPTDDFFDR